MVVQLYDRSEQIHPETINSVNTNAHVPIPPLESADRLSRAEFERRYQMHPEIKKAELIKGEVYVAPPVQGNKPASLRFDLIRWLGIYCAATLPGLRLPQDAVWQGNLRKMLAVLQEGLASMEHADFIKMLV